jgi:hypothetical protein
LPYKNKKIMIYRTVILPVVLYLCETWLLTLGEERRLRVFENRVLRRLFGPKRDEVSGEWGKLQNEGHNDLYSPNIIRVIKLREIEWVGHVASMEERRGANRVFLGRNLRERDYLADPGIDGRIKLRWIFKKWNGREADLDQDRDRWRALVNAVMKLRVP